jgi:hypothetical protein
MNNLMHSSEIDPNQTPHAPANLEHFVGQPHTSVWNASEPWTSTDGKITIQIIRPGMTIKYDSSGNWSINYVTDVLVTQIRWWYGFDALDSNGTRLGCTVYHPWFSAPRGPNFIQYGAKSTDIATFFARIANWNRFGQGNFDPLSRWGKLSWTFSTSRCKVFVLSRSATAEGLKNNLF